MASAGAWMKLMLHSELRKKLMMDTLHVISVAFQKPKFVLLSILNKTMKIENER